MRSPDLRPFRALRYRPAAGEPGSLLAPPYDVISPALRDALLARGPHNVVRLELPEERPGDASPAERYARAAATLAAWRAAGLLALDPRPAFYLYHQAFEWRGSRHVRRGFFVLVRLESPGPAAAIRPHERTLAAPRAERLELLRRLRAQVSPVLSMYRPARPLPEPEGPPTISARADGEEHALWEVADPAAMRALAGAVAGPVYIADGHHRYATALAHRDEARVASRGRTGDAPEEFVLMALVPAADLLVLPWHRLVDADATVPRDLVARLARAFALRDLGEPDAARLTAALEEAGGKSGLAFVALGLGPGHAHLLTVRDPAAASAVLPAARSPAWRALDVALLEHAVLAAALGMGEETRPPGALRYTHDPAEAIAQVRSGRARLAFLLNPTPVEQVLAVADQGEAMPAKSTYFFPKLPTGLVLYAHDAGA
jgi:uncharacterized protein (DUF1015 family)